MILAGIDAGSRSIKAVLFDAGAKKILAFGLTDQGVEQERLAAELFETILREAGLERSQISGVLATGYGRNAIRFADTSLTEITCHARGVHWLAPAVRTIVEIGGQDSKVISLEDGGRVRDFAMNDRCAAGAGRFLEMVASRLDMKWEKLAELGRQSKKPALISNMCVVFAETEIIGLLAEGKPLADVIAGVQSAIATRDVALPAVMRALSEPVRLAIVRQLLRARGGALACNQFRLGISKATRSHHFDALRATGLIHTEMEGSKCMTSLRRAELDKRFPGLLKLVATRGGESR